MLKNIYKNFGIPICYAAALAAAYSEWIYPKVNAGPEFGLWVVYGIVIVWSISLALTAWAKFVNGMLALPSAIVAFSWYIFFAWIFISFKSAAH